MLISRSVTGWPHHLTCRAPARAGRSPKPPRSGAAPGRHATGMWQTILRLGKTQDRGPKVTRRAKLRGSEVRQRMHLPCKQGYAGALPAISTSSAGVAPASRQSRRLGSGKMDSRRLPEGRSLAGARFVNKSAVIKTSRKRDPWCITTNSHHSPYPRHGFRSRSRRGARLSTVSLAGASPAGAAMDAIHSFTSGTRKTEIRAAWDGETPGAAPGCPTTFPPRSSADPEPVTSNHVVAGANTAGEISQVSK